MAKILCIDDNDDNLLILKALISEQFPNHELILSNNSREGIEKAIQDNPDLILLDIVMPDIDGYEVCRQLKANSITKDVPIVMVTATNINKIGRIKALECGADGFLTKPIDSSELTAQVRAMLKIKASHDEKLKEKEILKQLINERTNELKDELKERKKIEKDLRKAERYQKTLISNLPGFVYKCLNDEFWTMLYISDGCLKITGYSQYELINNQIISFGKIIQTDFLEDIRKKWKDSLKSKTTFEHEYIITTKSGEHRWVWERGQGIFDENNNLLHLEGFITDITDKKKADEGMIMSDRIFFHSLDMICIAGFDGYLKILNPAWKKTLGWELAELQSKPWIDFVHPDDRIKTINIFNHLMDGAEVFQFENRYLCKDGSIKWISWNAHPYTDESIMFALARDVSEKKQIEQDLFENRERYKVFINSINDLAYLKDENLRYLIINKANANFFNRKEEDIIGKTDSELLTKLHADICTKSDIAALKSNSIIITEETINNKIYETRKFRVPLSDKGIYGVGAYIREITQQKIAEEQLIKSEDRFRAISEYAQNAICIVNENGKITWGNRALEKLGGFQLEDVYKAPSFLQFIADESQDFVLNNFMSFVHKTDYLKYYQFYFIRSDGQKRLCEKYMTDFTDIDGHRNLAISMIDITESDKTSKILRIQYNIARATVMSEDLNDLFDIVRHELSSLIDTSNFIIAYYNEQTKFLNRVYGVDQQQYIEEWSAENSLSGIVVKNAKSLILKKDEILKMAEKNAIKLIGKRAEIWVGIPLVTKKKAFGVIILQSYNKQHTYNQQSVEILEIIASQLSLFIERKNLQQTALQLLKGVENSPVCTIITDINGKSQYINPMYTEVTGYKKEEVIGKKTNMFDNELNSKETYEELWKTILSKKEWSGELLCIRKNKEKYWAFFNISPILDKSDNISHFIILKSDITEDKKMLEDLIIAKEKAIESDRLKTAFLHSISHEIRTPMNGIMGFSELLTDPSTLEDEKEHYASIISNSCQQLLSVITDMINIAAIEAGQEKVSSQIFSVRNEMENLYEQFSLITKKNNLNLIFCFDLASNEDSIQADKRKVLQVLSNLLTNAVKYTPTGFIKFGCKRFDDSIEFFVEDSGIGIEEKYHHCVFDRFRQIENPLTHKSGGTGLGLAISKAYVELMGGQISLTSEPNKGSNFKFTIPFIPNHEMQLCSIEHIEFSNLKLNGNKILIAEDDQTNYLILKTIMKDLNLTLIHVENGLDAVNVFNEHPEIELVLMDIKMPIMDGIQATKLIKQNYPKMPIVAQTAFALEGDKEKMLDAGCDNYLSKPISKKELFQVLEKYLSEKD